MKELSLHLLDIVKNSITAGATRIDIRIMDSHLENKVEITITDNGCGMDPAFLKKVTDPFTTTRTTRKVGLGLPLFKMAAECAGGGFSIESEKGRGTTLTAVFQRDHIDRPPLGAIVETLVTLIQGSPDIDFVYSLVRDGGTFEMNTGEIREIMEGVSLAEPEVLAWIRDFMLENEQSLQA